MKFKSNIELQAGLEDNTTSVGAENQILTSNGGTGAVQWNDVSAISAAVDGVESNITYYKVKNSSGATIGAFKGVMAVGTDGNSGNILIDEMVADGSVDAKFFLGITRESIPNGGTSRVIAIGQISQVNTTAFTNGDVLWCDPATPGNFTITEPDGPNLKIPAAFVLNSATNGKIQVRVQGNEGIKDLYDTKIVSQVDGDVLVWDNTTGVWFNDSTLNVDYTAGNVGIGTTNPQRPLEVISGANDFVSVGVNTFAVGQWSGIHFGYREANNLYRKSAIVFERTDLTANNAQGKIHILNGPQGDANNATLADAKLTIAENGNVGIGTTSPAFKLQVGTPAVVVGSDYAWSFDLTRANNTERGFSIGQGAGGGTVVLGSHNADMAFGHTFGVDANGNPAFYETMRIQHVDQAVGNVGIGTTSPQVKLHSYGGALSVGDEGSYSARFSNNSNKGVVIGYDSTNNKGHIGSINPAVAWTDLILNANGGNVGIGTTSPAQLGTNIRTLDIKGSSGGGVRSGVSGGSESTFYTIAAGGYLGTISNIPLYFQTNNSVKATILANGNVGIGTTSPSEKLDVAGNIKLSETASVNNTNKFAVLDSGILKYRTGSEVLSDIGGVQSSEIYSINESDSIFTSKTLSQNISFGESYASNYRSRVLDYGGTFFPRPLGYEIGLMKEQELFQKAKLSLLPSGVGVGNIHNLKPKNDTFNFTRNSTATYVDEDGLIAVATINTPRLNYPMIDGVVSGCPSLLLEPQRTNNLQRSEEFENAYWTQFQTIPTANSAISPDGTLNADLITSASGASFPSIRRNVSAAENTVFSLTCFLKQGTATSARLSIIRKDGVTGCAAVFNLSTGVISNEENLISSSMIPFPNGWFRCVITFNSGLGLNDLSVRPVNHSRGTIGGNEFTEGRNLYLWGAQLEAGSYATSYIPTQGSSVTRVAETCNGAGDANTFNDSEGVLFAEISALDESGGNREITLSDGTTSNRIIIQYRDNSVIRIILAKSTGDEFDTGVIPFNTIEKNKIAIKYKTNDFAFWVNGIEIYSDNTGNTFSANTLSTINFDGGTGGNDFYGNVKQIQYFDSALNDTDLETLTSWTSFSEMANGQLYSII